MCAGKPLGRWALEAMAEAGLKPGLIVTGPEGVSFAEGWTRLINSEPEAGLASSLALAAQVALAGGARSLLVLLADMPLIAPAYLRELAAAPPPAATRHPDGGAGVPALLNHALIKKAAELTGDRGAAPLLRRAKLLDSPAGSLFDVDTPEDLAEAERILTCLRRPRESGDPASF
jgi:CTP:molybdopterin cytidylyltransferase MocA